MLENQNLRSAIESILLAADRPVTMDRFNEVFEENVVSKEEIEAQLEALHQRYAEQDSGIELRKAQGGYQLVTKTQNADWVRRFLQTKPFRLGKSALETLAIIAYKQPITRAEIDVIRGIDSSHLLRTLIERGIVKMAGKADVPGRPVQYGTTPKFLEVVGVQSIAELPPLSELDQLQGHTEDPLKSLEEGLDRFMSSTPSSEVEESEEAEDGSLKEIEQLIRTAEHGVQEVYQSPEEEAVAVENALAAKSVTGYRRQYRRKNKSTDTPSIEDFEVEPPQETTPHEPILN